MKTEVGKQILFEQTMETKFVKEERQNGKPKKAYFDPYQYEYSGYVNCDNQPKSVCSKCGSDLTWMRRVMHRVFFGAYQLHGNSLRTDGLWENLDAVVRIRRHYKFIGFGNIMPLHPNQEPERLMEKGICIQCRKNSGQRSLFE